MLRRRLQAMADETELLRAHSVENVLIRRQRSGPLAPLLHLSVSDDPAENSKQGLTALNRGLRDGAAVGAHRRERAEPAPAAGRAEEQRTLCPRVRAHKALQQQKGAADEATLVFNCNHKLIQFMVATCAKTTFLSASEIGFEDDDDEDADAQ
ncbi:hypothetical protein PF002_g19622 [Phytophthora fragariae]|uniref:Uncharacterized protein n=1 Tax=Phytophthora fragariae TaxID=53985 RepID=A0A6A3RPI3_9STRA|nr:hypothetical protein PF009_g14465 [Phytophthora fragariae]KAE8992380.1 hypothetical protein PF011_g17569 [Phytophthora fragariae]KAE9097918.1 hypothetical protein PF007_g16443 [Phytophthora fragariae]KAE9123789.1 hypothetical protein PF006_g17349 [Phytophthora fragariae]KAE9203702.1 hypothetical protein PF004_g18061 [Phytophthora fragariae]